MFKNEPLTDFSMESNRLLFKDTLESVRSALKQRKYYAAPIINGEEYKPTETIESLNPNESSWSLGAVHLAGNELAEKAVKTVRSGANELRKLGAEKRAEFLENAARIMRARRHELSSLMVFEVGKNWLEADADVCEAIDFCDYYAMEMRRLGSPIRTQEVLGESNTYFYQPRGVGLVIAPWNFPLAIPCGMTVASLVTGNGTILKPAEQSSLIAYQLARILLEAGIPASSFAFLPGLGEKIGAQMVEDPEVDVICFTGSKEVGLHIIRSASNTRVGQKNVKKVIAEMGGKNAIIVDSDADLDESVKGVIQSAFGFSGQKCSACSRVIVVGDAYEPFVERLSAAAGDVIIGKTEQPATLVGALIDAESQSRVLKFLESAKKDNEIAFEAEVPKDGFYVPPTIFKNVDASSAIWRTELFAPVLALAKADSFDEALQMANDSEYALTGGLFSRSPEHIQRAKTEFQVGNLYINRGCTGALVQRQPFGGFRMSGVGSKAGGPDYLIQFMEPRTVSENTSRRGFSPDLG